MEWLLLIGGAFLAGLIDAVVGGGGLIQLPLLLAVFPSISIPILFGTNKLSSIAGTASAVFQYSRTVAIPFRIVWPACAAALLGAAIGAAAVSFLSAQVLKPMVLVLLLGVAAYTWFKPGFGADTAAEADLRWPGVIACVIGFGLGFYDGFFGPGTGSFLIFAFVRIFGMDMLRASASAKLVNLATNFSALGFFLLHDGVLWKVGLAMACANVVGAQVGARLAVRHGNVFVRQLLLLVVSALILRLGWDLFFS